MPGRLRPPPESKSGSSTPLFPSRPSTPSTPSTAPSSVTNDTLSVSTGVIGLMAISSQTYNQLEDIVSNTSASKASHYQSISTADALKRTVKSFKLTIQLLYKSFRQCETGNLANPSRTSLVSIDVLITALTEAIVAFSEVGIGLNATERRSGQGHNPDIFDLIGTQRVSRPVLKKLRSAEAVLSKISNILQVESNAEARRYSAQAEEWTLKVLRNDNILADTLYQMPDSFNAGATTPQDRLEQVASQPPPGYSIPSPVGEKVPEYTISAAGAQDGAVTVLPNCYSVFTGLSLADIPILSLISLPFQSRELTAGEFYSSAFSRSVDKALGQWAEAKDKRKATVLSAILGVRAEGAGSNADATLAQRMGMI